MEGITKGFGSWFPFVVIVIISVVVSIVVGCNRREARLYFGLPSEEKRTREGLHLDFQF